LLACHLPDVAIVDLHLRGGERSDSLIGHLREQGVPLSCSPDHSSLLHCHR
jgi:hypothetical protein